MAISMTASLDNPPLPPAPLLAPMLAPNPRGAAPLVPARRSTQLSFLSYLCKRSC